MKKFTGYPKAYKRNAITKLLYLYKMNIIGQYNFLRCRNYLIEQGAK